MPFLQFTWLVAWLPVLLEFSQYILGAFNEQYALNPALQVKLLASVPWLAR